MSMTAAAGQLELTIAHTKIESSLSDFPVLIHLGTSSGQNAVDTSAVFSALGNDSNRKQISVTTDSAGTQQLYVEIEKWDMQINKPGYRSKFLRFQVRQTPLST
jgi:hypothetical protein